MNAKTTADFAPPYWVFSTGESADSIPGYSRRDFEPGPGDRASLFVRNEDEPPQIARLGPLTAIFDGELYDPSRLAREAGLEPIPDEAPAQLLLRCYHDRGESFFPKLRGMFAFVLWDSQSETLVCVRDPLGYYPCFFAEHGRDLLVSTSAKALLDHPGVSRAVNRLELLDYFFDIWARKDETFYENVRRISPGHALRFTNGNRALSRYWNPLPDADGRHFLKADELGRFEDSLSRSVNRCLAHGPVGIFLSGGLDSVSVAALASQGCRAVGLTPPHALSLVFPYPEHNEEAVQSAVARQLGLSQALVPLETAAGPGGLFGALRDLSTEFDFPIQSIWLPAYSHLTERAKQRGIGSILTGGGGDEWLGVTPYLAADLLRSFRLRELLDIWKSIGSTVPVSRPRFGWNLLWAAGLRPIIRDEALTLLRRQAPRQLRHAVRRRRAKKKPPWVKIDPMLWGPFLQRLESSETDFKPLSGEYGYYFGDALRGLDHPIVSWEMEENFQNAIRLRARLFHPYIDADLIALLCAVPPSLLTLGGANKGLVREVLVRRFPELGFERQKKIVVRRALPLEVLGNANRLWCENGGPKALQVLGLADSPELNTYLADVLRSDSHHDTFRAWQIMSVEHWLRAQM